MILKEMGMRDIAIRQCDGSEDGKGLDYSWCRLLNIATQRLEGARCVFRYGDNLGIHHSVAKVGAPGCLKPPYSGFRPKGLDKIRRLLPQTIGVPGVGASYNV